MLIRAIMNVIVAFLMLTFNHLGCFLGHYNVYWPLFKRTVTVAVVLLHETARLLLIEMHLDDVREVRAFREECDTAKALCYVVNPMATWEQGTIFRCSLNQVVAI